MRVSCRNRWKSPFSCTTTWWRRKTTPSISKNTMWVGQFQHQMELLEENGFTTITVDQLVEFGNRERPCRKSQCSSPLTTVTAAPTSWRSPSSRRWTSTRPCFPIGVSVGKDTYKDTGLAMVPHFSWEEAKEMAESGLVSIQSHTYDMHQWEAFETAGGGQCLRPNILRQPWETLGEYMQALREDVERSRQDIVEGTGQEAVALAYPGGLHDQISEELLRSLRSQVHLHHRGRESPGDAWLRAQPVWTQPLLCKAHHHRRRVPAMGGIKNF